MSYVIKIDLSPCCLFFLSRLACFLFLLSAGDRESRLVANLLHHPVSISHKYAVITARAMRRAFLLCAAQRRHRVGLRTRFFCVSLPVSDSHVDSRRSNRSAERVTQRKSRCEASLQRNCLAVRETWSCFRLVSAPGQPVLAPAGDISAQVRVASHARRDCAMFTLFYSLTVCSGRATVDRLDSARVHSGSEAIAKPVLRLPSYELHPTMVGFHVAPGPAGRGGQAVTVHHALTTAAVPHCASCGSVRFSRAGSATCSTGTPAEL